MIVRGSHTTIMAREMVTDITKMLLIQTPMALKDPADESCRYNSVSVGSTAPISLPLQPVQEAVQSRAGSQAHLQVVNCTDIFF